MTPPTALTPEEQVHVANLQSLVDRRREWWARESLAIIHRLDALVRELEADLGSWRSGAHADETGHLHRCAKVNSVWACAKGCAVQSRDAALGKALDAEKALEARDYAEWRKAYDQELGSRFEVVSQDLRAAEAREARLREAGESIKTMFHPKGPGYGTCILCRKAGGEHSGSCPIGVLVIALAEGGEK